MKANHSLYVYYCVDDSSFQAGAAAATFFLDSLIRNEWFLFAVFLSWRLFICFVEVFSTFMVGGRMRIRAGGRMRIRGADAETGVGQIRIRWPDAETGVGPDSNLGAGC